MKPFLVCTLLLLLIPLVYAQNSPAEGNFDCASYDARQSQDNGRGCLHRLKTDPDDYEQCRDSSNTTCYIFLQEPPFITLNRQELWNATDDALPLQRPFPCGDYASVFKEVGGIGGIAMGLHEKTSSKDDLCMWGGNSADCKFNQLVDYTEVMAEQDYRFAVTGLLLELPQRQCSHEASAPFVDNSMIIIGLKTTDSSASQGALSQLTRPFHWGAWAIFGGVVLIFMVVCFAIAVRFHVFRGRSLITAFFIFAGERDQALAHEASLSGDMDASHAVSFATKYGLAMTLYRIALLSFVGIFVLFYEVAVVNFLFQQQSLSLARSVTTLTEAELTTYAVLKNSALENVWNATVSGGRENKWTDETIPWVRCDTATECVQLAAEDREGVKFVVTFEIVGKYLLLTESNCETLTIFETKDLLYQFNAGWLYNSQVDEERRKVVDRELVGLRIDGTTRRLIDQQLEDFNCQNAIKPDIGPMIILIPCLVFVLPPLICSVLVLLLWKRRRRKALRATEAVLAARGSNAARKIEDSPSSSSV